MNKSSTPFILRSAARLALVLAACAVTAVGQNDHPRETVAVTYPLEQAVTVKFRGTTRLPRLSGEAKVKRTGRRNTRVELEVKNLPRAFELGEVYTTFILWAVSPEGRADNLGELKRSGSFIFNTKLDVTTPLQTFALLVTAEPHFLVRGPSRMVVLENLPPRDPGDAQIATASVQYIGNSSDYFKDPRVPDLADRDYIKTPVSLLGARQAVNLARFAGARRDATEELNKAQAQLEAAENAWRLGQPEAEVDAEARKATSLAFAAEETAVANAAARKGREEVARRDAAVRDAEESAANANEQIAVLRDALRKEGQAREIAEREAASSNQQLRELRAEVARLREEVRASRDDAESAKVKLARMEGERSAEQARVAAEQRATRQRDALLTLKSSLARFGSVKETERGVVLVLPDSVWAGARAFDLTPKAAATTVDPLAALLANNPDLRITIEAFADSRGDEATLQRLTQDRAEALAAHLVSAGVDGARIRAAGMGVSNPVAANTTNAGRLKNRRIEITLSPAASGDTSASNDGTQN